MAQAQQNNNRPAQAVALLQELPPSRLPVSQAILDRVGVDEGQWNVLVDSIFTAAKTAEAVLLALNYCKARNLDPFKRVVHIVPIYSSALKRMVESVWPGISELRTTAVRTNAYAGCDEAVLGPMIEGRFKVVGEDEQRNQVTREIIVAYPEWAKVTVYRLVGGQRYAFSAQVWWMEAYATAARGSDLPNEMWRKRTRGQIIKCAEAAALRAAFPEAIGNDLSAEEMEGQVIDHDMSEVSYTTAQPPRPSPPPPANGTPKPAVIESQPSVQMDRDNRQAAAQHAERQTEQPSQQATPRPSAPPPAEKQTNLRGDDIVDGEVVDDEKDMFPGDRQAPIAEQNHNERPEAISKMLRLASDPQLTPEQRSKAIDDRWNDYLKLLGDGAFVRRLFSAAQDVAAGNVMQGDAKRYLESLP